MRADTDCWQPIAGRNPHARSKLHAARSTLYTLHSTLRAYIFPQNPEHHHSDLNPEPGTWKSKMKSLQLSRFLF
jgi:hypothetical protein